MITNSISKDNISLTQFMILFWGGLLSPLVESLLQIAPLYGGKGAWLTPWLILPLLLLWGYMISSFCGNTKGFAHSLGEHFGKTGGKLLLWGYFLWGVFLFAVQLRLCAMGFLAVGYQEGSMLFILPALALFVWWMSGSSLGGFARSATIYFGILLVVFFAVLSLSVKEVALTRVLPLWTEDIPTIALGSVPVMGLFGYGIFSSFFLGEVNSPEKMWRPWVGWSIFGCFFTSVFLFIAIGTFGRELLVTMEEGFFQLSKGVAVEGGFQRMESVVLALWTLADLILLGVLLRGTAQCGKKIVNWQQSPLIMSVIILSATVLSLVFPFLHGYAHDVVLWGNLFFGWLLPCALFLLKKVLHSSKACDIIKESD